MTWRGPFQVTTPCRQGKRHQIEAGGTPGAHACSIPESWSSQLNWNLVVYEAGGWMGLVFTLIEKNICVVYLNMWIVHGA